MYKKHTCNSLLHKIGVIAQCYTFELKFCPEHNINTTRDINLQLFLSKPLFWGASNGFTDSLILLSTQNGSLYSLKLKY